MMPVSVISWMPSGIKETLDLERASRYPGSKMRRLQPSGNLGMMWSQYFSGVLDLMYSLDSVSFAIRALRPLGVGK